MGPPYERPPEPPFDSAGKLFDVFVFLDLRNYFHSALPIVIGKRNVDEFDSVGGRDDRAGGVNAT